MNEQGYAVCAYFAPLLKYPTTALLTQARACQEVLSEEGAAHLEAFCAFLEENPPTRWEEVYTRTFDLQPVCWPYVGYQLFGESYKRGMFMARLRSTYRRQGFDAGDELPDHLAVLLEYVALHGDKDEELSKDLLDLCIKPALSKMLQAMRRADTPYKGVLEALAVTLGVSAEDTRARMRAAFERPNGHFGSVPNLSSPYGGPATCTHGIPRGG